jgi:large subunit ribosomal protein L2
MNPVDHPHGGGEGKSKGQPPGDPVGRPDDREAHPPKHKESDKLIVRGRAAARRRR